MGDHLGRMMRAVPSSATIDGMRVLVLVVALALAACGDERVAAPDGAAPDGPDALIDAGVDARPPSLEEMCGAVPVTLDDWEDCYARRVCEWKTYCRTYSRFRDVEDCLAYDDTLEGGAISTSRRERRRAVEAGRAAIDEAQFTECLIETSATRCITAFLAPSCKLRFTGTIADGEPCLGDVECASPGATCARTCSDACCAGTCDPADAIGATCESFYGCVPGAMCDANDVCVDGEVGSECADIGGCDPANYCDRATQTCQPDHPPGAICTDLLQCSGETGCVGLETAATGTCSRLTQVGDACDAFCFGHLTCVGGTCQLLPAPGEPCGGLGGCLGADHVCIEGRCVARLELGAECHDATCRAGLFCTNELGDATPACAELGGDGAPCTDASQCASRLCSGTPQQVGECLPWIDQCSL